MTKLGKLTIDFYQFIKSLDRAEVKNLKFIKSLINLHEYGISGTILALPKLILGYRGAAKSADIASLSTGKFNAVLKALNISPVFLAIEAIVVATIALNAVVSACTTSTKELKEQYEDAKTKVSDYEKQITDLNSKIDENIAKINEYKKAGSSDAVIQTVETETESYKNQRAVLQGLKEDAEKAAQAKALDLLNNSGKESPLSSLFGGDFSTFAKNNDVGIFGGINAVRKAMGGDWGGAAYSAVGAVNPLSFIDLFIPEANKANDLFKTSQENIDKLSEKYKELDSVWTDSSLTDGQKMSKYSSLSSEIGTLTSDLGTQMTTMEEYRSQLDETDPAQAKMIERVKEMEKAYIELDASKPEFQSVEGILSSSKYGSYKSGLTELAKAGTLSSDTLEKDYYPVYVLMNKLGISVETLTNELTKASNAGNSDDGVISVSSLKEINDSLDTIQSNFKTVQDIIKGYNSETGLSIDNLQTLLSMGDDYINYLVDENGNLNLNTEAYYNLAEAQLQQMKLRIVEDGLNTVNSLATKADAVNYLTEATKLSTDALNNDIESRIRAGYVLNAEKDAKNNTTVFTEAMDKQVEIIAKGLVLADDTFGSLKKNTAATLGASTATDTLTDSLNDQKDALEEQQKALEDSKSDMEDAKSSISDLISLTTDMIKKQKEDEKEALENAKQAELDALEETQKRIQDKIDKQKELLDQEKEAYEFQKSLEEKQNSYVSNRLKEVATSFDDSSAGKAQNKKDKDTSKSSKKDLQEFLYEHTLDLRQEALDKMLEQENTYYDKQKESVENSYSKQVDAIDKFLSDEVAMYKAACNKIDKDNGTLYKQLKVYVSKYTTQTEAEFNHLWKSAQDAIARYRGDNVSLIDVMNDLQTKLYNVEDNIKAIKNRIDSVSQAISNTSSSISSTTAAVNNSTKAVNNYADALKNLKNVNISDYLAGISDLNGDGIVNIKDKTVQQKKNAGVDSGTISIHYVGLDDNQQPVQFDIVQQAATGTKSAKGGVTKVDEEGLYSELIPYQTGTGRYTILPEGNPVFSKAMTDNLWELSQMSVSDYANNIKKNIGDVGSSLSYVQNSSSISPTIVLQISGDATSATVTALKQQQGEIVNQVMKQTLKLMKMK